MCPGLGLAEPNNPLEGAFQLISVWNFVTIRRLLQRHHNE